MPEPKVAVEPVPSLSWAVNRVGFLEAHLAPHKKEFAELEKLRRFVADGFIGAASEAGRIEGTEYFSEVSARGWKRRITSMRKLAQAITQKVFFANCGFTLEKLETLEKLDPALVERTKGLIVNEQTGPRKVETFHKIAA